MYDAHVHVGYYSRLGSEVPFYYSPRRVAGVLRRCGVEDFIVSSTCVQVACIPLADVLREAREVKRVAGGRAHQFFWLTGRFYDEERALKVFDTGLYEGLKLHELETADVARRVWQEWLMSFLMYDLISHIVSPWTKWRRWLPIARMSGRTRRTWRLANSRSCAIMTGTGG